MRGLFHSRDGNFSALFALSLPVVLLSAGVALDVSRLSAAKNSLQNSVDASLMAASKLQEAPESRELFFTDYLTASASGDPFLLNIQSDFKADIGANYIATEAEASADVPLTIMHAFGQSGRVSVSASAYESTDALEVVMVLDNTGSMAGEKIKALREAAEEMVGILETVAEDNPQRNIRMGLVPYVTAVNIRGAEFDWSWIDEEARARFHGANFGTEGVPVTDNSNSKRDSRALLTASGKINHLALYQQLKVEWKGCVEARPSDIAVDAAPDYLKPNTLFVPYFAPDEPDFDQSRTSDPARKSLTRGDDGNSLNNNYLDDKSGKTKADFPDAHGPVQRSVAKYKNADTSRIGQSGQLTNGPNRACPTPVVPLTDDFTLLHKAVADMRHWNGSGTNSAEGLAWGTRVLSPESPYQGGDAFDSQTTKKVVILLTDGVNEIFGAKKTPNGSDYGSYGYLASGRMQKTDAGGARNNVNAWMKANCTYLKDRRVDIYTILLKADDSADNRNLYSGCATDADKYYVVNDVSYLTKVFSKIADNVAALHFTH
ncbi:pilus assembly protein [Pararhizobium haloflavum]|uniref:pilus assembly protein n=1 Tax=Pararhizobium haloflavum TaxID=2037914 RepID=UPI000C18185A|nr:pilus assembly protein [Pararhizobium haloflavum]